MELGSPVWRPMRKYNPVLYQKMIRIRIQQKDMDPDPDSISVNPQHCIPNKLTKYYLLYLNRLLVISVGDVVPQDPHVFGPSVSDPLVGFILIFPISHKGVERTEIMIEK